MKSRAILLGAVLALLITPATQTQAGERLVDGSGGAYLAEVVVRPVGLAGTILGTGFYIITWPFSKASGSSEAAKRELIDKPFDATFKRKFGDFSSLNKPKQAPTPAPATPATQPIAKTQPTPAPKTAEKTTPTAPTAPVQPQPTPAPTVEEK
jgi:cell division septation protein DedD